MKLCFALQTPSWQLRAELAHKDRFLVGWTQCPFTRYLRLYAWAPQVLPLVLSTMLRIAEAGPGSQPPIDERALKLPASTISMLAEVFKNTNSLLKDCFARLTNSQSYDRPSIAMAIGPKVDHAVWVVKAVMKLLWIATTEPDSLVGPVRNRRHACSERVSQSIRCGLIVRSLLGS